MRMKFLALCIWIAYRTNDNSPFEQIIERIRAAQRNKEQTK